MLWTTLDTWIVAAGALSAMACALLGNFLVLRRMSMMGDAISHAVLPGLAVAFLITLSRDSIPMFVGAAVVGVLTAVLTHFIYQFGKVEQSAAMGVVFSTLFALGLILIVRAANSVDLDPGCVLYGAIELIPLNTMQLGWLAVPRGVIGIGGVFLLDLLIVVLFFKELNISSFDPALATTLGINARLMHYLLMTLVAVTAVAAFESVGSILVIAMLIVPAAVAHLFTSRLRNMIILSLVVALGSAVFGHLAAITVPGWFGYSDTNTAGMMAVVSGLALVAAIIASPKDGLLSRLINLLRLNIRVARDDLLGALFRAEERAGNQDALLTRAELKAVGGSILAARSGALSRWLARMGLRLQDRISYQGGGYRLTRRGRLMARSLMRSHRLWETYLYQQGDKGLEELHFPAEQFEHVTGSELREVLAANIEEDRYDPGGRPIPGE